MSICLMSPWKSSSQVSTQAHVAHGDAAGAGVPAVAHGLLADPLAEVVVEVEEVLEQPGQPRGAVVDDRLPDRVDGHPVHAVGVLVRPAERRREALDEHAAPQPGGPVSPDVSGHFPGAEREADQGGVLQVEFGQQLAEIGGEGVEVVAGGGRLDCPKPRRS